MYAPAILYFYCHWPLLTLRSAERIWPFDQSIKSNPGRLIGHAVAIRKEPKRET
jgi:hypothetical protein